MAEMQQDVMEELSPTESPTENQEQDTKGSEAVENTESDVLVENYKRAMKKERERRKEAEAQLQQLKSLPVEEQDDTVKRFLNVEATTLINNKLLTDPSFRDRVDFVKKEMIETGKNIDDADNAVIARLFKEMIKSQSLDEPAKPIFNSLPKTATPEDRRISQETQELIDDFDRMAKSFG